MNTLLSYVRVLAIRVNLVSGGGPVDFFAGFLGPDPFGLLATAPPVEVRPECVFPAAESEPDAAESDLVPPRALVEPVGVLDDGERAPEDFVVILREGLIT